MAAAGFLSLSEWSFTICPTPYNRKYVLSVLLNKIFPFFLHSATANMECCSMMITDPAPHTDIVITSSTPTPRPIISISTSISQDRSNTRSTSSQPSAPVPMTQGLCQRLMSPGVLGSPLSTGSNPESNG